MGIPAYFVEALLREGKFDEYTSFKKAPSCKRCDTILSSGERDMCDACSKSVVNQVKFVSPKCDGLSKDMYSVMNPPAKNTREKRFGLGRV